MRKSLAVVAFAAVALVQPGGAVTFPSLTTIYVGSGVYDSGEADHVGEATSIHCSNVSGVSVQVRALVLGSSGVVEGSLTVDLAHGATTTFSTHQTTLFVDDSGDLGTGYLDGQGVVNIEATNSAVFCTAVLIDASSAKPVYMSPLHLVRVNPHPGTAE